MTGQLETLCFDGLRCKDIFIVEQKLLSHNHVTIKLHIDKCTQFL